MNQDLTALPTQIERLLNKRRQLWNRHDTYLPELINLLAHCQSQSTNKALSCWAGLKNQPSQQEAPHYTRIQGLLKKQAVLQTELERIHSRIQTTQRQTQTEQQRLNSQLARLKRRWKQFWMVLLVLTTIALLLVL